MTSAKLNAQDKRDLEKFTRFLALKAAQIIIQSRSGEKICTRCKPNSSGTDWFNLAIQDQPEVSTEAKRALCDEFITSTIPLCIEISLKTVEGDSMVLETWCLGILPEHSDPSIRVTYTVYNRMGILLKSLISVTRITPAYKLSRRQGPDSYVICYRIYMGDPALYNLGDNYKNVRVGQLCTPIGMIYIAVNYRTKMTISPNQPGHDSIMLKSDHFHSDLSPKHARYQQNDDPSKSLTDNIKIGAFVVSKQVLNEENDHSDIPFSSLLRPYQTPPILTNEETNLHSEPPDNIVNADNGNEKNTNENNTPKNNFYSRSRRNSFSVTSANDDFILVDLKTPFATPNTNSDLGTFYRECQSAPQIQALMEDQTLAEQVGDLTKQLEAFEISMHHYEDLLNSLSKSENNQEDEDEEEDKVNNLENKQNIEESNKETDVENNKDNNSENIKETDRKNNKEDSPLNVKQSDQENDHENNTETAQEDNRETNQEKNKETDQENNPAQ